MTCKAVEKGQKFYSIGSAAIPKSGADKSLPVPPLELRHFYCPNDDEKYLSAGKGEKINFCKTAEAFGLRLKPGDRILDFGCSSGRMLRWFEKEAQSGIECWGADIDAPAIEWAQTNLCNKLNFFVNSTSPYLPFEDNYFDFIYGNSIFTHLAEPALFWFLEIRRILKQGGVCLFSFNDVATLNSIQKLLASSDSSLNLIQSKQEAMIQDIKCQYPDLKSFGQLNFVNEATADSDYDSLSFTFYGENQIELSFGKIIVLKTVVPNLIGHQTGYLFKKPNKSYFAKALNSIFKKNRHTFSS